MNFPETNDVRERMQETARTIAAILPPGTGFVLLAFDLGEREHDDREHRMEYVANGCREDVVKAMKEFIAKTEGHWGEHVR